MTDVMGNMDIAFPNLHIYLSNVPKSISIFGFEIAFYGITAPFLKCYHKHLCR